MNGPIPDVGTERPRDGRPSGNTFVEGLVRDKENGNSSERREQAVNAEQHPRRSLRIDAESLEHSADQVGIERRLPGGRAGIAFVRTAESLTQSDRPADATHLPAKFEVVVAGAGSILMESCNRRQLQHKRQRQEPEEGSVQCRTLG